MAAELSYLTIPETYALSVCGIPSFGTDETDSSIPVLRSSLDGVKTIRMDLDLNRLIGKFISEEESKIYIEFYKKEVRRINKDFKDKRKEKELIELYRINTNIVKCWIQSRVDKLAAAKNQQKRGKKVAVPEPSGSELMSQIHSHGIELTQQDLHN